MSFLSQSLSSETLLRGLNLTQALDMSIESDPSPEELRAELRRLEVSHINLFLSHARNQVFNQWSHIGDCLEVPILLTKALTQKHQASNPGKQSSPNSGSEIEEMDDDDLQILFVNEVRIFGFQRVIFLSVFILLGFCTECFPEVSCSK